MKRWKVCVASHVMGLLCWPVAMCAKEMAPLPVELTLVDERAIAFATFQSHNQKVVSNPEGIFITYLHKSNDDYTAQQWRLAKSTDGGKSFTTIHEATHATSAPAIETDRQGAIYLGHPDFLDGNAYLVRLVNHDHQVRTSTTELKGGSAGKYCLLLDEPRQQLYWFAHNNTFFTVGMDGAVRSKLDLLQAGPHAYLQYPHLTLDSSGTLFAAWTTSKVVEDNVSIYHDVHAMKSPDGGKTWQALDGKPIELPAVADDTGPATLISRVDEFDVNTWLSAFMAKDGKLHFVYWAKTEPQRQWYIRYDIATGTREIEMEQIFSQAPSQRPNNSGVFVANRNEPGSRLYFVSTIDDQSRLACLASDDNGQTWHEYATSDQAFPARVYSIGAARELTRSGAIVGTFTVVVGEPKTSYEDASGSVYFFRIPTLPTTSVSGGDVRERERP
ncbi:MAG: hypothetical protein L0228_03895 [Planctomycetes bacterium]|nr:hypothetical protein [Planctomycetota bacterium]